MPVTKPCSILLALSISVPLLAQSAYYPELDELKTSLGTVRVVERHRSVPMDQSLTVNGKVVYRSPMGIGICSQFRIGDGVAVLFGENQGGNNWVWELSFLLLRPHRKPAVVTGQGFFSSDATLEARQEGGDVFIDLGFEAKRKKTARLHAGEVIVELNPVTSVVPVSEETCERLHKYSAEDCIAMATWAKGQCQEHGREYSGGSVAVMSDITTLEHHPGFSKEALGEICMRECKSGEIIQYEQFKTRVCSIR
jgi:hypothetical protein